VRQVRSLAKGEQARLFDMAQGTHPIGLADVVPERPRAARGGDPRRAELASGVPIFEKRFCRTPDGGVLWGYNEHSADG
jgi:hypothetical protein